MENFFDSGNVEDVSFEPLNPDWYPAVIIFQDYRMNKQSTGKLIELEFQFEKGKKVRSFYNISHKNETAQNIGRSEFKRVLESVGLPVLQKESDLKNLIGKKLAVKLGIREHDGNLYNEVKGCRPLGDFPKFSDVSINITPRSDALSTDDIPF